MRVNTGVGTLYDNIVHIPNNDSVYQATIVALDGVDDAKDRLDITMKPEAVGPALATSTDGRTALSVASTLYGALLKRKRETQDADRNSVERNPTERDAEYRAFWRNLSIAEQAAQREIADVDELAAVYRFPQLAGLYPDLLEGVRERLMLLNFIDRVHLSAGYPARPSLSGDLLATGVDHEAVMKAGEAVIERHRARLEETQADERTIRDLIAYLSFAFAITPEAVLEKVLP